MTFTYHIPLRTTLLLISHNKFCNIIFEVFEKLICLNLYYSLHLKIFNEGPNSISPPFIFNLQREKKSRIPLLLMKVASVYTTENEDFYTTPNYHTPGPRLTKS